MFALILIIFITFLVYKYAKFCYFYRGMPPTAPGYVPIIGHLPGALLMNRKPDTFPNTVIENMKKDVPPIVSVYIPGLVMVQVNDFELIKEFTTKRGELFAGRPFSPYNEFLALASNSRGIVNTNGEVWRTNRRFTLTWLRNFGFGKNLMEQRIRLQVDSLLECLADECNRTTPKGSPGVVNLEIPLKFTISSIIAQIAFGREYERGDPSYLQLEQALDDQFLSFSKPQFLLLTGAPWLRHIPLFGHFGYDFVVNSTKILLDYFKYELEDIKKQFVIGSEPSNIVEAYLTEINETKDSDSTVFNDNQIIGVIGDLWAAGMETTANTCLWAFLYMIHESEVQSKVYEEIVSVCGRERQPTMADAKDMPYSVATINEVQRMASNIPNGVSHAPIKDATLGGYRIPAKTGMIFSIMGHAYDPKVFPEPTKFRPERHLEADGKTLIRYETLFPFGMGKRVCLGESMARSELFLIFTSILQRFRIATVPGEEMPTLRFKMRGTVSTHQYQAALFLRE